MHWFNSESTLQDMVLHTSTCNATSVCISMLRRCVLRAKDFLEHAACNNTFLYACKVEKFSQGLLSLRSSKRDLAYLMPTPEVQRPFASLRSQEVIATQGAEAISRGRIRLVCRYGRTSLDIPTTVTLCELEPYNSCKQNKPAPGAPGMYAAAFGARSYERRLRVHAFRRVPPGFRVANYMHGQSTLKTVAIGCDKPRPCLAKPLRLLVWSCT